MPDPFNAAYLLSFFGWWQLVVCFFAFVALMAIWYHIGRKQNDFGQVWLALSVLCWSFSGGTEVFYAKQIKQAGLELHNAMKQRLESQDTTSFSSHEFNQLKSEYQKIMATQQTRTFQMDGWRSIFSLFNSLFILLALPWFRNIPQRIKPIIKSTYWPFMIGLPFLFSLLPTITNMVTQRNNKLVSELDVYYALLTLVFLGYVLWASFAKRRLPLLAWLSLVCILITCVAQLYKLTDSYIDLTLFSAIFKTSLIMIFFALALSWVKELTENIIPEPHQIFLRFESKKNTNGKFEHHVMLHGFPGKSERKIQLTPTYFDLCLAFAKRKIEEEEGWLEIKPKRDSRTSKTYDINDHNDIKRLLTSLLDGIFGKGSWTSAQHQQPLRNTLFEMSEKRERKIRLRIPGENISLPQ